VINVASPERPVEVDYYDTGHHAYGVSVDEDRVYVSDGEDGLYLFTFPGPVAVRGFPDVSGIPSLQQNHPNPFNPATTITFLLPCRARSELSIFDVTGKLITTLVDTELEAGPHVYTWRAPNIASGVYFYRLSAAGYSLTKKMVLLK
jgi:hypothetical protein